MTPRTNWMLALIATVMLSAACVEAQFPRPIQAAIEDLSDRLAVAPEEITVAGFEEVVWPDTSLGLPQPGEMYAQVQTPGYRVTLHAREERYVYHTDMQERAVAAETTPAPPEDQAPRREVHDLFTIVTHAKHHLAASLGIDASAVFVASVEQRVWPDASLDRPQPGESYAQVQTPGYLILLEYEGGMAAYHADQSGLMVAPDGTRITLGLAEVPGEDYADFVMDAIEDLAGRHGIEPQAVTVIRVEEVQWPDSARGLPEPGMMYTQAIVPGHRIVLEAGERRFAYHEGGGSLLYAGLVWDDDARTSLLTMLRADQSDGNNQHHLQRIDPHTGDTEIVTEFISSFAPTPDGRTVLLNVRRSRSSHTLEVMDADGDRQTVATAFAFSGMAIRSDGQVLACWETSSVGDTAPKLQIRWRPWHEDNAMEVELPGVDVRAATQRWLVWTDAGFAATVITADGPRSFYLSPDGSVQELGAYAVLGWIPRTRSLLVRQHLADGAERLATVIPGEGEAARLATAERLLFVAAPFEGRYVVAALGDEAGNVSLQRIDWNGASMPMKEYSEVTSAALSVAPTGDSVAFSRGAADEGSTVVLEMPGLSTLLTVQHDGPAHLIAD